MSRWTPSLDPPTSPHYHLLQSENINQRWVGAPTQTLMYIESDLQSRVGIQEESRVAFVSLKLGENKRPAWAEQLVGEWAGQRLLEHGLCQETIRENIFRLTTNKIKRLNTTKIKTVCEGRREKKNIRLLLQPVFVTHECVSHWVSVRACTWKEKTERKGRQRAG